eukprot:TRINITY_DN2852_c0_g1_i3.p1 TRINITY_DN2852_c0_g1~~TRINITY_DN2852_c0_g1_i3.p1  ORF type:complete len:105 (+),score=25.67 TRINITY_DN2852_c0_g1_i3:35-316(+)
MGVHFNTSIAKSFYVIDEAVAHRRPGLRHRNYRTIRDYMRFLQKEFPGLKDDLCHEYVVTYERARFGLHQFTVEEYSRFMSAVLAIVENVDKS